MKSVVVSQLLLCLTAHAVYLSTPPVRTRGRSGNMLMQNKDKETLTLTIRDCAGGIGLGLDGENVVDLLKPGMPASKVFELGDKVTHWNGIVMVEMVDGKPQQRKLKDVVQPADVHTVIVQRTRKQWETTAWESGSSFAPTDWQTSSWES